MSQQLFAGPVRWRNSIGCVTALACVFAVNASAQSRPVGTKVISEAYSTWDVSPFVGWQFFQVFQGKKNNLHNFESGPILGERFTQDFSKYLGLEESLSVGHNRFDILPFGNPNYASITSRNVQLAADVVFHLTPRTAKYRPFAVIGPGYVWYGASGNYRQPASGAFVPAQLRSRNSMAFTYGVGLKIHINRYVGVRFDVRGMTSRTPHFGLPDNPSGPGSLYLARQGKESALMGTFGIILRMGYHPEVLQPPANVNMPVRVAFTALPAGAPALTGGRAVCAGEDVRLTVNANGFGNITSYQWMVNGQPAAGATTNAFSVPTTAGGPRQVTVMLTPAPTTVTSAPVSVSTEPGGRYHLSAEVTGRTGQMTYQWMVNGQAVSGATGSTFDVPVESVMATKSVTVAVTAPSPAMTTAATTVTVNPLTPPTIRFAVSPSTVPYTSGPIPLAAVATPSQCGGATTIRYTGEGVTGTTFNPNTVSGFDMSNRVKQQSKVVRITATATDTKNQTAAATADVTVTLGSVASRLDDIVFPKMSARCNNCAKRILLEQLTPMLRNDPGAKVILVGHRDEQEKGSKAALALDQTRVINAAAVLSAGKGICPSLDMSRILVNWVGTDQTTQTRPGMCGASANVKEKGGQAVAESDKRAEFRRVEIWFVPSGAANPAGMGSFKEMPSAAITKAGCPK